MIKDMFGNKGPGPFKIDPSAYTPPVEDILSDRLVRGMFQIHEACPQIRCPFFCEGEPCEGVPHMRSTLFGPGVPPSSTSGPGLVIGYACEWGHRWEIQFSDHSGMTSIRAVPRS